jgi:prephenate dehydratase
MAAAQRVTFFKARIEDRPGTLLAALRDLKTKNLGLTGLWASPGEPGWANLYVVPKNAQKVGEYWRSASLLAEEGIAFFVKGTDKTGVLVKTLEVLEQAGVNLVRTEALAVGGKYGTFLVVAPEDLDRTAKALGAK